MRRNGKGLVIAGLVSAMGIASWATSAQALISYTQGDWSLGIGGTVNAFYVQGTSKTEYTDGSDDETDDRASVQNGLLPGWIWFVATTKQKGLDIKAQFGFAPGIGSNSEIVGLPTHANGEIADAYAKVDSRNVFFQFGNDSIGTFKFGRDIGLFMANPILNDMTLLGVGGTVRAAQPFNTSFGMIGHGYLYTGFQPQITYTTPNFGGFSLSAGVFNPSQYDTTVSGLGDERRVPQVQGVASFDWKASVSGKLWAAGVYNKTDGEGGQEAVGFEGGAKVGFGPAELLLSGFWAKGLSISTIGAQFLVAPDQNGDRLENNGFFGQLTYKVIPDLKLGVSYGQNTDKDFALVDGDIEDTKRSAYVVGAYYSLTPAITLVGEFISEKTKDVGGGIDEQTASSGSVGAILFF